MSGRIEALGQRFDPSIHEAIMDVDDPSRPPGTVIRVVEDGYTINERLLRPARVFVSKRHGVTSASDDKKATRSRGFLWLKIDDGAVFQMANRSD